MPEPVRFIEHEEKNGETVLQLDSSGLHFAETKYEQAPSYLGVYKDVNQDEPVYKASYYIGAAWLVESQKNVTQDSNYVIVTPKVKNLDYLSMLNYAMEYAPDNGYFEKFYGISLEQPLIHTDAFENELSLLMITHYICLVKSLVKKGLKKGYIIREENLKSKIKGRILHSQNFKHNIPKQRMDCVYCCYQEFTDDIPENRLIKKALLFCKSIIDSYPTISKSTTLSAIPYTLNKCITSFGNVSDEIEVHELKTVKTNKLYKEYSDAIRLAKMILKRYDYSISNIQSDSAGVPPFWIDMSRLFEMYVYGKLIECYGREQIKYQVPGHCESQVDFIRVSADENIIIDAKYKPRYQDGNSKIIGDIREISGYARDKMILKHFGKGIKDGTEEVSCLIIYPETNPYINDEDDSECDADNTVEIESFDNGKSLLQQQNTYKIPSFRNFYKISLKVPLVK